jgi:hypothetical protein
VHLGGETDDEAGMSRIEMRPPQPAGGPPRTDEQFGGGLGSIDSVRAEVADAYSDMKGFHNIEPDQVLRYCSGHSARLSEIKVLISQVEPIVRQWRTVRVNEVEPAIEELRSQFSIASRLIAVRELDWKMSGPVGP